MRQTENGEFNNIHVKSLLCGRNVNDLLAISDLHFFVFFMMHFSIKEPQSEDFDLPEDAQLSPEEEEQLQARIGTSKLNLHLLMCF